MPCTQKYGIRAMIHEAPVIYIMNTLHVLHFSYLSFHFQLPVYHKHTLLAAASESTKPKVNSYCFDSTSRYVVCTLHSNRNHCI